jgi:hypothetical protein
MIFKVRGAESVYGYLAGFPESLLHGLEPWFQLHEYFIHCGMIDAQFVWIFPCTWTGKKQILALKHIYQMLELDYSVQKLGFLAHS